MFVFQKKEMDIAAAQAFWSWFEQKEPWIVQNINASDPLADSMGVIMTADKVLKPVFPYFRRELEFQMGFNDGKGEFLFFHMGNRNLIRDGETLGKLMPRTLRQNWTFLLER